MIFLPYTNRTERACAWRAGHRTEEKTQVSDDATPAGHGLLALPLNPQDVDDVRLAADN
jgi:hypothetical protein